MQSSINHTLKARNTRCHLLKMLFSIVHKCIVSIAKYRTKLCLLNSLLIHITDNADEVNSTLKSSTWIYVGKTEAEQYHFREAFPIAIYIQEAVKSFTSLLSSSGFTV